MLIHHCQIGGLLRKNHLVEITHIAGLPLLESKTMTYESVMSHDSHLEFLQRAKNVGYRTYLYFIGVEDPVINKDRVKNREKLGGHGVPEDKITPRYKRSMGQLFEACLLVNRAYIFDNSLSGYYMVAEVHEGELTVHNESPAAQLSWHKTYLIDKFDTKNKSKKIIWNEYYRNPGTAP